MQRFSRNLLAAFTLILGFTFVASAQTAGDPGGQGEEGTKVMRIGVLMPKVDLVEAKGDMEAAAALRNTYAVLLNSETIQVVALNSRLASLALEEAQKKNVDYILNLRLFQEQKKKKSGLFGRIARDTGRRATWETARKVPYGGSTGGRIARTTARSAIINTGYTLSSMKIKIKKSDKFILDYALTDAKGESLLSKTIEAKAKKKNDDQILIKMFEESGEDIVSILRKRPGR
mgnify:CR=1 FL=1